MKASKAIALPLLLVIMLGAMGLSYAYWTETLVIDDNVNTGDLKVRMGDFGWYTYGDELLTTDWSSSDDGLTVTMTLGNMYPGASHSFRFRIKNLGSIPAVIDSVTLTVDSDPGGLKDYIKVKGHFDWYQSGVHIVHDTFGPYLLDSDEYPYDVDYWMYRLMDGRVLLPGDMFCWEEDPEEPGEGSLCFYLLDGAPEGQTITFTLKMTFKQWNY